MKKRMNKFLNSLLMFGLMSTIILNSCQDNSSDLISEDVGEINYGRYSENVVVKNGLSSVTLAIYADDKSLLDQYLKNTLEISPIDDIPVIEDQVHIETNELDDSKISNVVTIKIVDSDLKEGFNDGFNLSITPYDSDARGWSTSLFVGTYMYQKWSLEKTTGWYDAFLEWSRWRDYNDYIYGFLRGGALENGFSVCREWDGIADFNYWEVMVKHRSNNHIDFQWHMYATVPNECGIEFTYENAP